MSESTYLILEANDFEHMTRQVNKLMEDGWEPLGGPFAWMDGYLGQAMVQRNNDPRCSGPEGE